jgi:hypothetical protein
MVRLFLVSHVIHVVGERTLLVFMDLSIDFQVAQWKSCCALTFDVMFTVQTGTLKRLIMELER